MWDSLIHRWLRFPYQLHIHEYHRPKHPRATVLLIHGLGTSWKTWQAVAPQLPDDVRVIAVDLLGFGESPKPNWATYNAKIQANAIVSTLLRKGLFGPVTICGHSLGSIVAVEIAKRYPFTVKSLILCSPPFYRAEKDAKLLDPETRLRQLYRFVTKQSAQSSAILRFAERYKLWPDTGFMIGEQGSTFFLDTLTTAIINQTAFQDALKLHMRTYIVAGLMDPFVIARNNRYLAKHNPNINYHGLPFVRHDIDKTFAATIAKTVTDALA